MEQSALQSETFPPSGGLGPGEPASDTDSAAGIAWLARGAAERQDRGEEMDSSKLMPFEGKAQSGYYVWEPQGKAISIELAYDVVDRMSQDIMRGFGAVPRRGAEVGGVLLGTAEAGEKLKVRIDDFQAVPSQYLSGPSYLLSSKDRADFEQSLDRWKRGSGQATYAVGYYRSHTRDGALALGPEDISLMDQYFASPEAVALLVRPFATRVSIAGFFFREDGVLRDAPSCLEFPFRRKELGGGVGPLSAGAPSPPRQPRPDYDMEDTGLAPRPGLLFTSRTTDPEDEDSAGFTPLTRDRKFRSGWIWIPLSFIFLLFGVLLGFQAATSMRPRASVAVSQDPFSLALSVSRETDSLNIKWNPQSGAVKNALRGVLTITDGSFNKAIDLDGAQLQVGAVIYKRISSPVQLRLEIFTRQNNSVVETMEYREALRMAPD